MDVWSYKSWVILKNHSGLKTQEFLVLLSQNIILVMTIQLQPLTVSLIFGFSRTRVKRTVDVLTPYLEVLLACNLFSLAWMHKVINTSFLEHSLFYGSSSEIVPKITFCSSISYLQIGFWQHYLYNMWNMLQNQQGNFVWLSTAKPNKELCSRLIY